MKVRRVETIVETRVARRVLVYFTEFTAPLKYL